MIGMDVSCTYPYMGSLREDITAAILQYIGSTNRSNSCLKNGELVIECKVVDEEEFLSIITETYFLESFGFSDLDPVYPFEKDYVRDDVVISVPMIPQIIDSDPDSDIDLA